MSAVLDYATTLGRYLLSQQLVHLIVHVTNHCNFRCDHCFIDFSPKRDLKLSAYQALGRDAGKLFWLDIGGGEPFLRKDLADIVGSFDAKVVQIPSNGALPDLMETQCRRMLDLGDREVVVSLSLDGLRDTHDRVRKHPGSYDQVWNTFERLKKIDGLYVKVLTVLHNENVGEILDLMREVKLHQPDHHSVILVRGETMRDNIKLPPVEELRKLGREIFAIQESYDYGRGGLYERILRNFHRFVWKNSLRTIEEQRQVIPCLAGTAHMVVMGDGRVSSCEMLEPVGDLKFQSWEEIKDSAAFKQQVADIKAGKCYCTHNCAMMDSIFFNPRNVAKLVHQSVD